MVVVDTNAPPLETNPPVQVVVDTNAPTVETTVNVTVPSSPSATLRTDVLTSFVNNISLSNPYISPNGTTPASHALAWMIANDTELDTATLIRLDFDALSRSATGFRIRQRYPLLAMWFQQDDFGTWAVTDNWLEDPNECNWYGISCASQLDTISGENQSAVTRIFFNGTSSYAGAIPLDIVLLSNLQQFVITDTNDFSGSRKYLQGTLPDSVGNWTALTYFDISINGLTGSLPKSIGNWTALTYFEVSYNYGLTGTLPYSIGQ
jgi:hypothetical protein